MDSFVMDESISAAHGGSVARILAGKGVTSNERQYSTINH